MKEALRLVAAAVVVCAFFLFAGFGIGGSLVAPNHAIVFVDANQNVYIAPSCVPKEKWPLYPHLTIEQADKLKLSPEAACRDAGGFIQEGRSLTGHLFQKIGLLDPPDSRWNADGTWNW